MIDDMASLKQAMEQMDADDVAVAEAAKDRAAQILSDAKLSFSKMAELIEQRRLLLRPKIVTSIKRMDQPDTLGDAAFRDTGASLRREGQSFRQIAEALELSGGAAPRYEDTVQKGVVLHPMEMEGEPDGLPGRERRRFLCALSAIPSDIPSASSRSHCSRSCCSTAFRILLGLVGGFRDMPATSAPLASARTRRCRR